MQTGNTEYIYKNDLDKACFQHDMAYGQFKDLNKRTQSDKVLRDKAFEIASYLFIYLFVLFHSQKIIQNFKIYIYIHTH